MKKLILGLLLIFSFSYGEENIHLVQNTEVVTLTTLYASKIFNLSPSYTKEIIREVLAYYERVYGSDSLASVSLCLALNNIEFHDSIAQCNIGAHLTAFHNFIEDLDKDDYVATIRVATSFGLAWIDMVERKNSNENKNKKRI